MSMLSRLIVGSSLFLTLGSAAIADSTTAPRSAAAALLSAAGAARPMRQGQPPADAAAAPAAPASTPAVILAVEGKVRFRLAADKEWQPGRAGALLSEGAEIETGIRSAVQIKIGVGQVLTIDRASRVAIKEAISRAGTEKTTVDLPYGRVKFDVSSATVANDVQIQAPDATLAVKGTTGYMEVTPGQPTLARGDQLNTGTIAVSYSDKGTTATIVEDQATNAETPDPASSTLQTTQLDTSNPQARSGDEAQQVASSPGGGESLNLVTGGGSQVVRNTPPASLGASDFAYILSDVQNGNFKLLRQAAAGGDPSILREGPTFSNSFGSAAVLSSLALGNNPTNSGIEVYRLESSATSGWRLLGLDLSVADSVFSLIASNPQTPAPLVGLATIGNRFFASTVVGTQLRSPQHTIVEILPGQGTLVPRMELPFDQFGRDAGGITERGTMILFGAQLGPNEQGGFYQGTIYEIDPRSNFVVRTSGPMITGPSTVFDGGTSATDLAGGNVVGLTLAGGLVFAQVFSTTGTYLVTINPIAAGTSTNPSVLRVAPFTGTLPGLASEARGVPPAPFSLSAGTGTVDPALSPLFAAMGFGPVAITSPFFRTLVTDQIVSTSVSPALCAGLPILTTAIGPFLAGHVNQTNGVGLAVNDFRTSLPSGHPCLRPGQMGNLPPVIGIDFAGDVFGRDLQDNETVLATGFTFAGGIGAAVRSNVPNGSREFLVLNSVGGSYDLLSLSLNSAPFSVFNLLDTGSSPVDLFGLATVGNQIYAGGLPPTASLNDELFGVFELIPGQGSPTPRMQIPFFSVEREIAGSNERGSLFIIGESAPGPRQGTTANSRIFEVDPRNNYIRAITNITFGPSTVATGIDLTVLQANGVVVTGSAYVGTRLVVSIMDTVTGQRYFAQINPAAAGTSTSPTVVRVTQSTRDILGLGSESLLVPPAPITLGTPTNASDSSLGPAANIAYSAAAAARAELGELLQTAIVNSSIDPVNCRLSTQITIAGTFLAGHANQIAGFGQSATNFRASLPPGHPCGLTGSPVAFDNFLTYIDISTGALIARDSAGVETLVLASTPGINFGVSFDGLARVSNNTPQGKLFRLEVTSNQGGGSWTLLNLDLNNPATGFNPFDQSVGVTPLFFGLGSVDSQLYANAPGTIPGGLAMDIHQLNPGQHDSTLIAQFPIADLFPGLAGSTERGTIFFVAQVPTAVPGTGLTAAQVFEFDPRNNRLVGVTPINVGNATVITGTFDINNNPTVLGLAYLNNRLVMSVVDGAGNRAFIAYNPAATGSPSDPSVVQITQTTRFPRELASERLGNSPGPFPSPASTTEPDFRTSKGFAGVSYGSAALPAATAMISDHVLATAQNTSACASDSAFTSVPAIVGSHLNQVAGVGQSLGDFRNGLPFNHVCQVSESLIGYLFVSEANATVATASIDATTITPDPRTFTLSLITGANQTGGLAIAVTPNGQRNLLRLETLVNGSTSTSNISSLNLRNATADFVPTAQFTSAAITGIGAIGPSLFGAGFFGVSLVPGIASLNLGSSTFTPVIDTPFLGNGAQRIALGASNERGTLFTNAIVPDSLGGSPHNAILEFDPRNNYFVDAFTSDPSGPIQFDTGTLNNAAGFTSFDQMTRVDGIAYNQGLLTVSGIFQPVSGAPTPVQFQLNTLATANNQQPFVRRIDSMAAPRFGLAGNLAINPPSPANLNPDVGPPIDTRGLNALFADLAYSQRAFNSGVVTRMAEVVVINGSQNPASCAGSIEIQSQLGPALGNHINQRAGMGRGIDDFRNGLPVNHPCRP